MMTPARGIMMTTMTRDRRLPQFIFAIFADVFVLIIFVFLLRWLRLTGFWPDITLAAAVAILAAIGSKGRGVILTVFALVIFLANVLVMAWIGIAFFL
jgi:hypothetical protein